MTRPFACLCVAALLCGAAIGQSAETPPQFDAADVHASAHTNNPGLRGPFNRNGRYEMRTATMLDLVRVAYGVDADKVLGGPSWLEMDRFDVVAKAPLHSTPDALKTMLQALLADRFKLTVHNDTKPLPAYALTAGKRPALKKSDGTGDSGCKLTVDPPQAPPPGSGIVPTLINTCHNMTMQAFAEGLRNMPGVQQFLSNLPVQDKTGLEGSWDFVFKYSIRGFGPAAETVTATDALEKDLGLKLETITVPTPVILVDSVNRTPTDNLPGVQMILGDTAPPAEFEVADIKPTSADFQGARFQIQPSGRIDIAGVTLKLVIEQAWNITDDMLVGAPKWLDTDRFDIVAKAPALGPASGQNLDVDTLLLMLRSLVVERFKLAVHNEVRPVNAYTLMAVKPKMKPADPTSRTRFHEGTAREGDKDPRNMNPALSRLVSVQNMTMAQFAEQLQRIAPGYIHSPVLDATGLDGSYDFTLNFSPIGLMQNAGGGGRGADGSPSPPATTVASDPTGGITLFEAIEKQLGLKLELQKRPVQVLVIDHIEQKPIDN